jgi:CBS domain-containing protein
VRVITVMERDVPMCHVDATVDQAVEALDSRPGWNQCVVVNDAGIVIGVVSRDARGVTTPLADAMHPAPTTVRPDVALDDAYAAMRKRKVAERVVTDPTGRLLGVLRLTSQ